MANYIENYITQEEYYAQQQMGIPYEGFVVGLGYIYSKEAVIMPPNQLGGALAINTPASMNHFTMCTEDDIDTSQYAKEKSYMQGGTAAMTKRIADRITKDNHNGTITVNVGGTPITIPKKSSSVQIDVRDTGSSIEVSVKAKNTATRDYCSTKCSSLHEFAEACMNMPDGPIPLPKDREGGWLHQNRLPNVEAENIAGIVTSVGSQAGAWAERIMDNRNAYKPRCLRYSPKNLNPIIKTPLGLCYEMSAKWMSRLRTGGKVLGAAGAVITAVNIGNDIYHGRAAGAVARGLVWTVAYGCTFIPYVGWALAIGIGVADVIWGDPFYDWVNDTFSGFNSFVDEALSSFGIMGDGVTISL